MNGGHPKQVLLALSRQLPWAHGWLELGSSTKDKEAHWWGRWYQGPLRATVASGWDKILGDFSRSEPVEDVGPPGLYKDCALCVVPPLLSHPLYQIQNPFQKV